MMFCSLILSWATIIGQSDYANCQPSTDTPQALEGYVRVDTLVTVLDVTQFASEISGGAPPNAGVGSRSGGSSLVAKPGGSDGEQRIQGPSAGVAAISESPASGSRRDSTSVTTDSQPAAVIGGRSAGEGSGDGIKPLAELLAEQVTIIIPLRTLLTEGACLDSWRVDIHLYKNLIK